MDYVRRMDEGEQKRLLSVLKKNDLYKRAAALDKKQRAFNKGKRLLSDEEIVKIVRDVRRKRANAGKRSR